MCAPYESRLELGLKARVARALAVHQSPRTIRAKDVTTHAAAAHDNSQSQSSGICRNKEEGAHISWLTGGVET